ncbi:CARDB domain-containing protein [Halorussus halophilus]|uniref:CARDB domain-containing protein n=1 Tax=Halorussus halophilus TaxID=2650975 RepID=UPI0017879E43|nr:CARDB domain-containing protein [Halorussus halophilus]
MRHKGTSLADSLPAFQANPALIYDGISPQSGRRVNREWALPLKPFGAIAPMFDQLGEVGQDLYGAGAYPEMARIQYHPLGDEAVLYVDGPTIVERENAHTWRVEPLGHQTTYDAHLEGETDTLIDFAILPADESDAVALTYDTDTDCYRCELAADNEYEITRRVPKRAIIVEDFQVTPESISVGETATVSMTVKNTSALAGTHEVSLTVGRASFTQSVTLNSHSSQDVRFEVSPETPGTYNVTIAHENRALHVEDS